MARFTGVSVFTCTSSGLAACWPSWRSAVLLLALAGAAPLPLRGQAAPTAETVFFLVRHAEKVDDSRDPELTAEGRARAEGLAGVLASVSIDRVFTTDFIRTRDTAAPVARAAGVEAVLYDPSALADFASELLRGEGRVLIVGHSNTTPDLVRQLGGDPGTPIADDEYDRLYVVRVGGDGAVSTLLIHFGG